MQHDFAVARDSCSSATEVRCPSLGILTWPSRISHLLAGQSIPSLELAARAAEQTAVDLYFFRTQDVELKSELIHGWQRQDDGSWVQTPKPWPDVFHLAMVIRNEKGVKVKKALLKHSRPINIHDVLGKWEVHQALSLFPCMEHYLPETILYTKPQDLQQMLMRHKSILAKPGYGLGAMQISRVWRMDSGLYGWEDSSTGERAMRLSWSKLWAKVIENAAGPFVVQEELPILETAGKRNKVRVILNKDGRGQWQRSVSYAYIGRAGQFAVSRHQGAEQLPLYPGLRAMGFSQPLAHLVSCRLTRVARMTARCIDQVLGPMGELGLDLAVGERGRVWLIEANARPNKDNLPFARKEMLMRPFLLMMEYARYLAREPLRPMLNPRERGQP